MNKNLTVGINCLREAGATLPITPREPLSRIGTFFHNGMAAVTPVDAHNAQRAVGCFFIRHRLLHGCLMPVDHSSWQGSDTINALPRGALSPNGGRLSDGWRQAFRAGKGWSNSGLIAISLVASLIVTVLPGIVVRRGQRDDTSSYGSNITITHTCFRIYQIILWSNYG